MTTELLQAKQKNKVLHVSLKDYFSVFLSVHLSPLIPLSLFFPSPFVLGPSAPAQQRGSDNRKRNPPLYTVQTIIIEKGYIWPPWQ
jgi:hypothetical protein